MPVISNRSGGLLWNLIKSVQWYSKLFGIEFDDKDYPGPVYTFDMGTGRPGLTLDNHCFDEIYHLEPSNQPLFNLSTSDIHASYQHVKEIGGGSITEIQVYPDLSEFSFKDPDGHIIMVCSCFT